MGLTLAKHGTNEASIMVTGSVIEYRVRYQNQEYTTVVNIYQASNRAPTT